jgi:hypothetical protein
MISFPADSGSVFGQPISKHIGAKMPGITDKPVLLAIPARPLQEQPEQPSEFAAPRQ